jgi:thioredoxin 1
MNRIRTAFTALAALVLISATPATDKPAPTGVQFFQGTWKQALAKAKAENKHIFLDTYASWCGPCRIMQARTFPDKKLGEYFNQKFVSVKIDVERGEGPQLADKYGIQALPTLLFLDGTGKVVRREEGLHEAGELLALGKRVAK